jgi:predicted transcriptional regulator
MPVSDFIRPIIEKRIHEKGWTVQRAQANAGLSSGSLYRYLKGSDINATSLCAIMRALDLMVVVAANVEEV